MIELVCVYMVAVYIATYAASRVLQYLDVGGLELNFHDGWVGYYWDRRNDRLYLFLAPWLGVYYRV